MNDKDPPRPRYMFEWEVAEEMRCATSAVKRYRLAGRLPYIPGRPVLIERADFEAFMQARKDEAAAAIAQAVKDARPFSELSPAEQNASARAFVLKMKARPKRTRRTPAEMAEWRRTHPPKK